MEDLHHKLQFNLNSEQISENRNPKQTANMKRLAISACSGLGGIGKTQLALHYIYHSKYPYTLRVWFPAENLDLLRQKYIEFARIIGCKNDKLSIEAAIFYINTWLAKHPGWLLVYDNVENYSAIQPFLPDDGGHIILTTRQRNWPDKFQILSIDIMTENEAIALIKCLSKRDMKEEGHMKELVKILGYLPLAIAQAGAYIQQNQISIGEYLKLYKEHEDMFLADNTLPEGTNSLPVAVTWNISLAAIDKEAQTSNDLLFAKDILTVCSYLNPEKISRQMLLTWLHKAYPKLSSPQMVLNKHISKLWQYSMINFDGDNFITVHRLVQTVLRHQHQHTIVARNERNSILTSNWFQILLESMHNEFKQKTTLLDEENHKKSLLPHLQLLVEHYDKQDFNDANLLLALSNILKDIADIFHWHMANSHAAKLYYERALEIRENHYGKSHIEVAKVLTDYGDAYGGMGDPKKQKEILEFALAIKEKHYGMNDRKLIKTLESLGAAHWALGNAKQSVAILERGVKIGEEYYGKDSIAIAKTLYYLGNAYGDLGNMEYKKENVQRALTLFEKFYGKDHYQTAFALADLGIAYRGLGDSKKGQELLIKALWIQEQYYGAEHLEVGETLSNLSNTYIDLGEPNKAINLLLRSVEILEHTYGNDHVYVARTLNYLGDAYVNAGYGRKARTILEKALTIKEKNYEKNHISIAITLTSLGKAYIELGEYNQGLKFLSQALKIKENYYGNSHQEVAITLLGIIKANMKLKKYEEALPLAEKCYSICLNSYGENHNLTTNVKKQLLEINKQLERSH